jgi:hypothetical protein
MLEQYDSVDCECICYAPYLSTQGNIDLCRLRTREERAAGWPPGYTEPDTDEQKAEKAANAEEAAKAELTWTKWLLAIVGIKLAEKEKEPEPDPTFDPNWQPEFC